jgi:hypothetical protein
MPAGFPDTRWSPVARADGDAAPLLALYARPVARYLAVKFPDAARDGRLDDVVQDVLAWMTEHPEVLAQARPDAAVEPQAAALLAATWRAAAPCFARRSSTACAKEPRTALDVPHPRTSAPGPLIAGSRSLSEIGDGG